MPTAQEAASRLLNPSPPAAMHEAMHRKKAVRDLPSLPLFSGPKAREGFLTFEQRVKLAAQRAKAIVTAYGLTAHDVSALTQTFWDLHVDPAMAMDTGAGTLVTIQINLVAGTLSQHLQDHPSRMSLMKDILEFKVMGHYCLTEVAHGLDAINIETIATGLPDGSFILDTPNAGAAKIMPPTSPYGEPAIGIVFAKLIIEGKNHGIRPFIVPFHDGHIMMPGVAAKLLPPREGSPPVYHSITSFDNVKLPAEALLGPRGTLTAERATVRANHLATIWRTAVGALALGGGALPALDRSAFIAARYSQRRTVGMANGGRVPILYFRTQHAPILTTLAQSFVSKAFWKVAIDAFRDPATDFRVRHAWATIFKATVVHHAQTATLTLSCRVGAQGLFAYNDIISHHASLLGIAIAEGDILGLCIRLVSELLIGRYSLPESTHPDSLLARHEKGLLSQGRALLEKMQHHRSDEFNRFILPKCDSIVRAIGHRMAYDAAVDAGLDSTITDLYLVTAVKLDSAWYVEKEKHSCAVQDATEDEAIVAALPRLEDWLDQTGVEAYCQVPILSQSNWDTFVNGLKEHTSPTSQLLAKL